jgi:DNA invertase Pin-like site-specific DNA recombinase
VSTEDQSLGPDAQRAAVHAWAQRSGVTIESEHLDRLSGGAPADERPGLLAAVARVRELGAGLLLVAKRDRLARDVVIAATIEQLVRSAGGKVVSADGVSAEDTPEGQLMRTLLDAFAAYERALIKARTRAALRVKRDRGEFCGGQAPYGYHLNGDGRIHEHPAEQRVLADIRKLRAMGTSVPAIVRMLNADRAPCRGKQWHVKTCQRILAEVER